MTYTDSNYEAGHRLADWTFIGLGVYGLGVVTGYALATWGWL